MALESSLGNIAISAGIARALSGLVIAVAASWWRLSFIADVGRPRFAFR